MWQAQALVVGLLAAVFAIVLGWVPEGKFNLLHGLLLCTSSVLTAGIASFVLGMFSFYICLASHLCQFEHLHKVITIATIV
jgi:solute carrier family 41